MRRKAESECPANDCLATNPKIYNIDLSSLPKKIQDRIKEKQISGKLKKCSYCGTIWAEDFDIKLMKIKIGTNKLSCGKMIWFI